VRRCLDPCVGAASPFQHGLTPANRFTIFDFTLVLELLAHPRIMYERATDITRRRMNEAFFHALYISRDFVRAELDLGLSGVRLVV
jgi:hypothetical protein